MEEVLSRPKEKMARSPSIGGERIPNFLSVPKGFETL